MAKSSNLCALLGAREGEEASLTSYREAALSVIEDPERLGQLLEADVKDSVLIHLTNHGDRFAQLFRHLRSAMPPSTSQQAQNIAANTSDMFAELLPDLHQLFRQEPQILVQFVCPALEVCLTPSQPRGLQNLARVITSRRDLLEHVAADPLGSAVVQKWSCFPGTQALDIRLQALWTERLVNMVSSCAGNHDVAHAIQQWSRISALKGALLDLEKELVKEGGKKLARTQITKTTFPILDNDFKDLLKSFKLPIPGSVRMVQSHIESLLCENTPPILRSVVASFPCKLCLTGSGAETPQFDAENQQFDAETQKEGTALNLHIDVLGKGVGIWKIILSGPVFAKFQDMGKQGIFNPVKEKLVDLWSGHWGLGSTGTAGSPKQRDRLRVPLTNTECGRRLSILWQISVGIADDLQAMQQVILVWDVGDWATNSKTIDRVIAFQQGSYTEETVRRCNQRLFTPKQNQIPAHFEDCTTHSAELGNRSVLDIRTVDQATIQMANKFYTLTEPMIGSVLANDLAAEFPFDLSKEEARCITHSQTASLILGRSGTGKTSCLVFKMVGKYLTSKAVKGGNPARQILLTRSSFLADKIKAYTRRLIKTLTYKPAEPDSAYMEGSLVIKAAQNDHDSDSVLTLRDESFPLVCTFDRFLQLLENTAVDLDRQDFRDSRGDDESKSTIGRGHEPQLVDFHAFRLNYWPRMSQTLVKGLSIHLVFAEIMGVIKGSESSRASLAPLSRADYLRRSSRLAPTFVDEEDRSRVYNIYKAYESLKNQSGDFDHVDRVVKILEALRQNPPFLQALRSKFDEIYIDEVQDQRCLDLELLMNIIRDGRGFHFAGDTAQAISQDSTFRFDDVKKMLFSHFSPAMNSTNQAQLGHATRFELSKNYRSHQGILALASLIMRMMWEGFPETIDKLSPEIGILSGPKPVLFVGCDTGILGSSSVGSAKPGERSADFGAEQVILVRDPEMKAFLQSEIGDAALILTIAESKGMEFDDVILWNFFTACTDQAGIRSLVALKNDPAGFDSRQHSGMCPELKNLYVAVTRARTQLFIIETSEVTAVAVQKLLVQDSSGILAEVTRPSQEDFAVRVESMRPSSSIDPAAWARRAEDLMEQQYYKEALLSYRRSGDRRGTAIAQGHVSEEEGIIFLAKGDIAESALHFEAACAHFMQVQLVEDAVRVLIKGGSLTKAATILEDHQRLSEAANLFLKVGSYPEAVRCYHSAGKHAEAAATWRSQGQYDLMVSYINDNREQISAQTLRSYCFLCKLLLKQNKLSVEHREDAIKLLGSPREQEQCFNEYGMVEELAQHYVSHQQWTDLYRLFFRTGQLEKALKVVFTKDVVGSSVTPTKDLVQAKRADNQVSESQVLQLLDYSWAGHLINGTQRSFEKKLRSTNLTSKVALRVEQWATVAHIWTSNPNTGRIEVDVGDSGARWFLVIWKILKNEAISRISTWDALPFDMAHEALGLLKSIVLQNTSDALSAALFVTGIWNAHGSQTEPVLLPWSPLQEPASAVGGTDATKLAQKWILARFAAAILALEAKARALWSLRWSTRCVSFMTKGFCKDSGRCQRLHQTVSKDDHHRMLQDLLQVNNVFCNLAIIYYRNVLGMDFQRNYLKIRRRWLERRLSELAFLSAVTQETSNIRRIQLVTENKYPIVCSSLQELLYFRLGKEWGTRNNFTSLLEQMQLAEAFGPSVQSRLFRALSHRLLVDGRDKLQRQLSLLYTLLSSCGSQPGPVLQSTLQTFLLNLDNIEVPALSTLHALTAIFEALAAYLIIKTCLAACLVKQSWIDLYLPRLYQALRSDDQAPTFEQNWAYQRCLIDTAKAFSRILRRLNEAHAPKIELLHSGKIHNSVLLMQRNAEMLSIIVANLAAAPVLPDGFGEVCGGINRAFDFEVVRTGHLKGRTSTELVQKLVLAFRTYNGKDSLVVVVKDRKKGSAFADLEGKPGVKSMTLDELCPPPAASATPKTSAENSLATPATSSDMQYSSKEVEATLRIQRFWRSFSVRLAKNRAHMLLPESRAIAHFVQLCTYLPLTVKRMDQIAIRGCMLSKGPALSLRLERAQAWARSLQRHVMDCVEKVEIAQGVDEAVDAIMTGSREVEELVEKVGATLSDKFLKVLLESGGLYDIETAFEESESMLEKAEEVVDGTKRAVAKLSLAPRV